MKNLLNNISQEEKERILEMHKKNITVISEQKETTGININGVDYLNPNITTEAKLNAFLDTGDLTRKSFPSLYDRFSKIAGPYISGNKGSNTEMQELLNMYDKVKIPTFVKNYLIFIAKQKKNPSESSLINKHFEGQFKKPYDEFRTFKIKEAYGPPTIREIVDYSNISNFTSELFNLIQKQTEKAKRA